MGLVLFSGLRLVVAGLGVGLVGALAVGRLLASRIPEVNGTDSVVLAMIAALLGVAGTLASLVPAYAAVRIPPSNALRSE